MKERGTRLTMVLHIIRRVEAFQPLLAKHVRSKTCRDNPRVLYAPFCQIEARIKSLGDEVFVRRNFEVLTSDGPGERGKSRDGGVGRKCHVAEEGAIGDEGGARESLENVKVGVTE